MKELIDLIDYSALLERIGKSNLEVGSVDLGPRKYGFPVPEGFIHVGSQECDPIAVDRKTGEVVLLDHEVPGRIMQKVANNLHAFMSALAVIEGHYKKCEKNESLYEDEAFMRGLRSTQCFTPNWRKGEFFDDNEGRQGLLERRFFLV
jgi:hypothetical protein